MNKEVKEKEVIATRRMVKPMTKKEIRKKGQFGVRQGKLEVC